jgi:hypothetical protein
VPKGTELCPHCGDPVDISRFAELELKVKPDLRKARSFLGTVAGLGIVGLVISVAGDASTATILVTAIDAAVFGTCFLVAFWAPLGAAIAAMAVFLLGNCVAIGAGEIGEAFEGFILKIIFLFLLASGIRAGYRVRDLRGQWRKSDRIIGTAVLVGSAVVGLLLGFLRSR